MPTHPITPAAVPTEKDVGALQELESFYVGRLKQLEERVSFYICFARINAHLLIGLCKVLQMLEKK
jgi:hypothetical protein